LKREFGLFLSDDEEERARKHGTYLKKYKKKSISSFEEDKINFYFRKMKKSRKYSIIIILDLKREYDNLIVRN